MRSQHASFLVAALLLAVAAARPAAASPIFLDGLALTKADAFGAASGWEWWNTAGGDNVANLFVIDGPDPDGAIANGGSDTPAIHLALDPGLNHFAIRAWPNVPTIDYYALNVFFDGGAMGISGFRNLAPGSPLLPANGVTWGLGEHDAGPAANTLVYTAPSGETVTLRSLEWNVVPGSDRVGTWANTPDGQADWVGSFTLEVTPEPATLGLMGVGMAVAARRRRRR